MNKKTTNRTDTFELAIMTNSYAGNFERELCAHLFGWASEYASEDAEKLKEQANKFWSAKHNMDSFDHIDIYDDEHGPTCCELYGNKCFGINVKFTSDPSEFMPDIIERIGSFPAAWVEVDKYADPKLEMKSYKLVRISHEEATLMESKIK